MLYFKISLVSLAVQVLAQRCPQPCENGGLCFQSQQGDGAQCFCKPPWTGLTCSEHVSPTGDSDDSSSPTAIAEDAPGSGAQTSLLSSTSGINVVSMDSLPMPQVVPHDLDDQDGARAMPSADANWTPAMSAENQAQETQELKSVLQHEYNIDDQITALTKRIDHSFQNAPLEDATGSIESEVPQILNDGDDEDAEKPVVLEPLASAVPVQQPKINAVYSAVASGRSTRRVQKQLPSAGGASAKIVEAELVMTKESDLLSDKDTVRFGIWSSLCPDVPCKLKVYLDDIEVLDSHGTTLLFQVTPSDPAAASEEILLDIQGQIQNKGSPLFSNFPDIDPSKSSVKLKEKDGPIAQFPAPPAPGETVVEPPPPSKEVLGKVPQEKPPPSEPVSPGTGSASEDAAKKAKEAAKTGEDPGKAAADGTSKKATKESTKAESTEVSAPAPPKGATASADDKPPPMSTTMQCIMNLTAQFFVIFTIYQFVRSYNAANGLATSKVQQILEQAKDSVQFAPMLCILFVGIRMRALQLSQNQGAPPLWVQQCMLLCSYSVLVQCLLVVCIPMLLGEKQDESGEPMPNFVGVVIAASLTVIRYLAVLALYGGMVGCCVGVIIMTPADCLGGGKAAEAKAKEMWGSAAPPVSPALQCTMNLTIQFFVIYLLLMIFKTVRDFSEGKPWFILMKDKVIAAQNTLQNAATTVFMAPMLCILFIAARMRALQIDPKTGAPQPWAQACFHVCTYCLLTCCLLTLLPPLLGTAERGATEEDVTYKMHGAVGGIVTAARFLALLGVYGGFTAVMYSMFVIENPNGPTPPLAPAMQCVQVLCLIFFGIYLIVFILQTVRDFTSLQLTALWSSMQTTLGTVQFAPMLCVLFIAVRMRAQEVAPGTGSPQGWAQEAMYLCCLAILIQIVMCLLLPLVAPAPAEQDADGNVVKKRQGLFAKMFQGLIELIKYAALFMLYGGVIIICFSAFVITSKTANGKGHLYDEGDYTNDYFPKVPPMSTTMMCIINLTAQYFVILSALIILRKLNDAMEVDNAKSALVNTLEQTKDSVTFAPMLCVLFLGARMRSQQLTQNQGAPQPWVQICMLVCVYAVLTQCLMVLFVGLLLGDGGAPKESAATGEEDPLLVEQGDAGGAGENAADEAIRKTEEGISRAIAAGLTAIRFGAMLGLYGAMTAVCVGVLIMTPEDCMPKDPEKAKAIWGGSPPPVSPAVQCVMFMTIQFFVVYLMLQVMGVTIDFLKSNPMFVDPLKSKLIIVKMSFQQAADTVVLAPMLCILFVGARMRALQLDPKNGAPQSWAQICMFVCAYSLMVGTGLCFLNPIFATLEPGEKEDDPPSLSLTGPIAIAAAVVRFLCIGTVYGAACAVLYSSIVIQAPDGKPTPPLSPAMLCVMALTIQFFVIMSMIFVTDAVATYTSFHLVFLRNLLSTAKVTCLFCPMLAILFIATRMRALEITKGKGAPPGWVQDGMFFATGSILLSLILCFFGPIPVKFIQAVAGLLSTLALFALYGGIVLIVTGLFMMTPEACDGKGSLVMKHVFGQ